MQCGNRNVEYLATLFAVHFVPGSDSIRLYNDLLMIVYYLIKVNN